MVRVLVTGAGGALGRAWVDRLGRTGLYLEPAFPGPVEVVARNREELDVASIASVQEIQEIAPDLVLNCARRTELEFCEASPGEAFRVNRDGAEHVARACAKRGALPVYFSTDLIYDGGKLDPYREEETPNPLNAYGESKLAGEVRTMGASRRHLIVRTGWVYGHAGQHFLRPIQDGLRAQDELWCFDAQVGQATWIGDFLDGVLHLLKTGQTGYWHVASPGPVTQMQVMRRALEKLGLGDMTLEGRGGDRMAQLPAYTVLDGRKLAGTGVVMRAWEKGLHDFLAGCPRQARTK